MLCNGTQLSPDIYCKRYAFIGQVVEILRRPTRSIPGAIKGGLPIPLSHLATAKLLGPSGIRKYYCS